VTELRVPKNQAETLLQQQIERGRALAADGLESRSEADYDDWILAKERWKSFSSAALARIYGDESGEKEEFDNSGRVLMVVGGTPWTVEQQRAVERVRSSANVLVSLVERLEIAEEPFTVNPPVATKEAVSDEARKPQGVFVVHGRDEAARESVARVLERAGREVVILHEQANRGRTLIEKFEQHATEAGFAVILLTGDDVGGLVHRARRGARLADRRQHGLDLPCGDLRRRSIAKRGHDVSECDPAAALVRGARLCEHRAMAGQRGRLRAAHALQPSQVGTCGLAEGRALRAALTLGALEVCRLGDVLGHELRGSHVSSAFVVGALGDASAVPAPAVSVGIAFKPRGGRRGA
jgi:hypothetical protein